MRFSANHFPRSWSSVSERRAKGDGLTYWAEFVMISLKPDFVDFGVPTVGKYLLFYHWNDHTGIYNLVFADSSHWEASCGLKLAIQRILKHVCFE